MSYATVTSLLLLVGTCHGQWQPPAYHQPPPIGFIPIYQNVSHFNQTNFNNGTNFNQTRINATSTFNQTCIKPNFDVPKSHSLFQGCRQLNDTLLFNEVVSKSGKFFRITEKYLDYPEATVSSPATRRIYAIFCYDLKGMNKGGYATILSGGVGHKKVRIHLYTRTWNTPLHFHCQIFGK